MWTRPTSRSALQQIKLSADVFFVILEIVLQKEVDYFSNDIHSLSAIKAHKNTKMPLA